MREIGLTILATAISAALVAALNGWGNHKMGLTYGWTTAIWCLVPIVLATGVGLDVWRCWNRRRGKRISDDEVGRGDNDVGGRGAMADEKNIFNVTSNHQAGGITAGQVFVGQAGRHLDDRWRRQLREALPRDKKINVIAVLGDGEAFQFANEVMQYLKTEGYDAGGVNQAVFSGPVTGQQIREVKGEFEIVIGTAKMG